MSSSLGAKYNGVTDPEAFMQTLKARVAAVEQDKAAAEEKLQVAIAKKEFRAKQQVREARGQVLGSWVEHIHVSDPAPHCAQLCLAVCP